MTTAGNYQKTPVGTSLSRIARQAVDTAIHKFGKELPCSVVSVNGAIVTVKFEINDPTLTIPNITIPVIGSEYVRLPIQKGDKGKTIASDAYLGGMSGLGGGVATMRAPANLEALVFSPIGNKTWVQVDGNAVVIYGPNGVVLRDTNSGAVVTLTPTGINCTVGGTTFVITAASITATTPVFTVNAPSINLNGAINQTAGTGTGAVHMVGPVTVVNNVTAGTISLETHVHGGVQPGSGNTAGPS